MPTPAAKALHAEIDLVSGEPIIVRGAGVTGLWQALYLARRGHAVRLTERTRDPFTHASSVYAGAMLAPYCEEEQAEPIVRDLGLKSMKHWREAYPDMVNRGTLVMAQPRDKRELDRFARMTQGHERIDEETIGELEPDLAGRFRTALYYASEAHLEPEAALHYLLGAVRDAGVDVAFGVDEEIEPGTRVIDCSGLAARGTLTGLRGVRGERAIVRCTDVNLTRTIRLLHPRFPIYVVPWADNHYMVGATQLESEAPGPATVRAALELLSTVYAVHPAFGEAEIVDLGAGLRPAFSDNLPRIIVKNDNIYVNGLFRHGFLLAPVLAEMVTAYIEEGAVHPEVFSAHSVER